MNQHQKLVKRLLKPSKKILSSLSPQKVNMLHAVSKLCSEAGELMDAVGKWVYYEKNLDIENVKEEFGDIEFYLEAARSSLKISREETLRGNIKKLTKRYGKTYSNKAAIARADKA